MQKRPVEVLYFDGISAVGQKAYIRPLSALEIQLSYHEHVEADAAAIEIPYKVMEFIGAVARRPAVAELPNDARIEFINRVPHWFNKSQKQIYHWIWQFERSPAQLLTATLASIGLVFAVVKWGIPSLALFLAQIVPDNTVEKIGHETERQVLAKTAPSKLSQDYQQHIQQRFLQEIAEPNQPVAQLIFRQGKSMGANAMAIANNTIIVTDELVHLVGHEDEVLAVLAHEQGHLVRKHAMQKLIAASSVAFTWQLINYDGSSILTAAAVALSDAEYSQRLEHDADDYAMHHLHENGISSLHLANFLQRVENIRLSKPEKKEKVFVLKVASILKSHPDEEKRIALIHAFSDAQSTKVQ
jgi:Zn-dependent protease with chaperone function